MRLRSACVLCGYGNSYVYITLKHIDSRLFVSVVKQI